MDETEFPLILLRPSFAIESICCASVPLKLLEKVFSGLSKSASFFASKPVKSLSTSNGSRVNAMLVVDPYNNAKYETLSYLPALTDEQIAKQVQYIIRQNWTPCIEFDRCGGVHRTNFAGGGYYDGRYWDSASVLREIEECGKAHTDSFVRVLGFDAKRQVQVAGFLVKKPSV
ncbi:hypothetical protein KP509_28G015600 [Ceratopteris richardii]|uniref:Ribulose bisphosphate carboxylase small subunit, chloroplastic n=1 Tax=Ceratopteris richardii TaxID=49495 RepID=A0A8T2R9V0_CERRI|nr:hypothetical protein KP509_28G015600 [Ceratopteris richardii]